MLACIAHASFVHEAVRDGTVVKALAFHQCGPGSIPGVGVICGLSWLLVLVLASGRTHKDNLDQDLSSSRKDS